MLDYLSRAVGLLKRHFQPEIDEQLNLYLRIN